MEITAENFSFRFGAYGTSVHITPVLPGIDEIAGAFGGEYFRPLIVCDENTEALAVKIAGVQKAPLCILKAGEANKGWPAA
ncbi:MAG: hypothetical protein FWH38_08340, partial [Treponema sp.]|nr:hypothetical protein [Treponema sp.]